MKVVLREKILRANDEIAEENRKALRHKDLLTINLVSSPGAGKTTLLEKTIAWLRERIRIAVIEGDVYTTKDAERIAGQGVDVVQINTQGGCHLDAHMVGQAMTQMDLNNVDLLVIENVGNLVCPAGFDLGEDFKVAVLSATEGGDKVAKYPVVFQKAEAVVLNKADLIPFTDFDLPGVQGEILGMHPGIPIFVTSARTGEGVEQWCNWLEQKVENKRKGMQG